MTHIAGAQDWSYDPNTGELTSKSNPLLISRCAVGLLFFFRTNIVSLPKPQGGTVPAVFALDVSQNALELVTDVPTFLSAAAASEPSDQQPILVVRSTPLISFLSQFMHIV